MGMDAEVFAIGPKKILRKAHVLEYKESFYDDVDDDDVVLGFVVAADTTDQSRTLACICGVEPWDLGHHRVTKPVNPRCFNGCQYIGDQDLQTVHSKLVVLTEYASVQVWYRPNG